jgi:xanthine dehydrogenase accessory factor
MYDIALTVAACLGAGTRVDVAWAVETHGFSDRDLAEAVALTPGGGRVGGVLSGSLNEQLAELSARGATNRVVDLQVSEVDALVAGLSCGGDARCLIVSAADLPAELWPRLREREPVVLVSSLDGDRVTGTVLYPSDAVAAAGEDVARTFGRGASAISVSASEVVTILWPVPKLVVVGAGAIAEALVANAALLGWHTETTAELATATGLVDGLAGLDKLVVLSHDDELAGPVLRSALAGSVGYIGALGSRRTQQARADWLAYRGITDLARIHGPAGLDIGANSPGEIAVAILAEALAVAAGKPAGGLRERPGPIHQPA